MYDHISICVCSCVCVCVCVCVCLCALSAPTMLLTVCHGHRCDTSVAASTVMSLFLLSLHNSVSFFLSLYSPSLSLSLSLLCLSVSVSLHPIRERGFPSP